ncbi:MAG: acriflavin resistance protein [Deltaproteobacteria bacterium]|nr:acriflavin resistance protein [Deltaproteobacteria bacterium]
MTLSDLSVRRPVFAAMLILGLVVIGLISMARLEMKLDPDIDFPFLSIVTELRGASPETVEREVTDVIEEGVNSIEGVHTMSSVSSQGLSRVMVQFDIGHDVDVKAQEVRDKVALARPDLPLDIEDPLVQKWDIDAMSFMAIVLGGVADIREISDIAEHEVKERLERIGGIGSVEILGSREREVRIWLDPLRLTGYGLSIEDVTTTLRRENAELASGRIEGAAREWSVTTQGKARSVEEFGEIIVAERAGRLIHLRDVAVVEDGMAEARSVARLNGNPGVAIELKQQSGSDLVAAAREVRKEVEAIAADLPAGIEMKVSRDYAKIIEDQVRSVLFDMVLAATLVVIVVLLFLRNFRSTFISGMAIPASVIATFTFFLVTGLSLNNMTLMALTLAIGLVIDDAIVVLESIFRKVEDGKGPIDAALEGSREVALAVLSTTLAVCGVFVPIFFMTSTMGRYFYEFGVTVVVAVLVSTLVAFTLTPSLASRILSRNVAKEGAIFRWLERALVALENGYRGVLDWSLRHRLATSMLALLAVAGGCGVMTTVPVNYFTRDDMGEIAVRAKLPIGTPLAATERMMHRIEAAVREHPQVHDTLGIVGDQIVHEPHRMRISVFTSKKNEREESVQDLFEQLRVIVAEAAPDAESFSVGFPDFAGGSGEFTEIQYGIQGPSLAKLQSYSDELVKRMKADPRFTDVRSSFETGKPQIPLDVDRGRAADLGVSAVQLGRTLRTLLAGEKVGSFEDQGNRYDVRVQVLPEYRDDPSKLDLVRVRGMNGELVPIAGVADLRIEEGPVEVRRRARSRLIEVGANTAQETSLGEAVRVFEGWARELGIERPYSLVKSGQAESMDEAMRDIVFALGLAMLAIYMILASLFNSLTHPLVIMVSAPLSFIGGFLALKIAGLSFDIMSAMGLLVLMGLVMKNGILLVDYTHQLREQGLPKHEAILRAGPIRMRPVLMTSAALVCGLLPMALSDATGSEFRAPMAVIVIGGLATSTALTLIVVPVVYDLVDTATQKTRNAVRRLRGKPAAATAQVAGGK